MKIAILNTRLSGYMKSCLETFKRQSNAELLLYVWPHQADAPFEGSEFASLGALHNRNDFSDRTIYQSVVNFQPDAVLVSGWKDKGYVKICKQLKAKGHKIISGCDTQWKGSLRQQAARLIAPFHLHNFIDVMWVTGERQRYYAKLLGYEGDRCWDGYYACDWDAFSLEPTQKSKDAERSPFFLYVGRYAPEKGLDTLTAAYRSYRQQVQNPWPLVCAGAGPLKETLIAAGAEDRGFVQPSHLPALMQQAAAFVLPSKFEPWGVVVQEAAASGLPLILSDACGAGVHLLREGFNGFGFSAGCAESLASKLCSMHALSNQQRSDCGAASYNLSKQYTPKRWSTILSAGIQSSTGVQFSPSISEVQTI